MIKFIYYFLLIWSSSSIFASTSSSTGSTSILSKSVKFESISDGFGVNIPYSKRLNLKRPSELIRPFSCGNLHSASKSSIVDPLEKFKHLWHISSISYRPNESSLVGVPVAFSKFNTLSDFFQGFSFDETLSMSNVEFFIHSPTVVPSYRFHTALTSFSSNFEGNDEFVKVLILRILRIIEDYPYLNDNLMFVTLMTRDPDIYPLSPARIRKNSSLSSLSSHSQSQSSKWCNHPISYSGELIIHMNIEPNPSEDLQQIRENIQSFLQTFDFASGKSFSGSCTCTLFELKEGVRSERIRWMDALAVEHQRSQTQNSFLKARSNKFWSQCDLILNLDPCPSSSPSSASSQSSISYRKDPPPNRPPFKKCVSNDSFTSSGRDPVSLRKTNSFESNLNQFNMALEQQHSFIIEPDQKQDQEFDSEMDLDDLYALYFDEEEAEEEFNSESDDESDDYFVFRISNASNSNDDLDASCHGKH